MNLDPAVSTLRLLRGLQIGLITEEIGTDFMRMEN